MGMVPANGKNREWHVPAAVGHLLDKCGHVAGLVGVIWHMSICQTLHFGNSQTCPEVLGFRALKREAPKWYKKKHIKGGGNSSILVLTFMV